jgi:hypothetical protein
MIEALTMDERAAPAPVASHMIGALVQGVFIQALRDAAGKNTADPDDQAEARSWLLSEDGELYAWVLGVDLYRLRVWLADGCPWPKRGGKKPPNSAN